MLLTHWQVCICNLYFPLLHHYSPFIPKCYILSISSSNVKIKKIAHSLKDVRLKSRNIWKLFRLQHITTRYYAFQSHSSRLLLKMLHKTPNTWNYCTLDSLTPINNLQFVITKSNFFRNISSLKKKNTICKVWLIFPQWEVSNTAISAAVW